jgi:GDP-L-fucose synthase
MHSAKIEGQPKVPIWGSGRPRREFLYVDDLAMAAVHLMNLKPETYWSVASERLSHINVGAGVDISILELARLIRQVVGYQGELVFDETMPDGAARKLMDSTKASSLGWHAKVDLFDGLIKTYSEFLKIDK